MNFEMIIKRTWINLWRLLTMINLEVYWPWLNFDVYWPGLTCRIDLCYIKIDSPLLTLPIFVCHFTMIVIFIWTYLCRIDLDLFISDWTGFTFVGFTFVVLTWIYVCRIDLDSAVEWTSIFPSLFWHWLTFVVLLGFTFIVFTWINL